MDPEGFSKNRKRSKRNERAKRMKVRKRIDGEEDRFGGHRLRGRTKRVLRSWLLLIAVLTPLLVWGGLELRKRYLIPATPPPRVFEPVVEQAPPLLDNPENWKGMVPAEVARKFMEADDLGSRLRLVRHPVEVVDIMKRFYTEGPGSREKPVDLAPMEDVSSDDKIVTRFAMKMEDGSMRLVSIPFTEDGLARVDFKAYARYCSHPWPDILSGKAREGSEMRVFLSGGSYYNRSFSDESRWMSFVASSPDLGEPIFLYADRTDASLPAQLKDWSASPGTPPVRCTLSLESLGDSYQNRQLVLKKLLYVGWVDPE